ncbi:diguanylate cyclase [Sphingomonas sp. RHCKR7]|uniref:diguanylate cyclase domain-containing protein n=1 Tax=Sphingomonas folli TaxID=2862497 RepID=UPI001CA5BB04|nr:diguanylate cyclase [Sphingomonas folli]MBW6526373.1 diguanylate cyclase [Sphingomonas folli]
MDRTSLLAQVREADRLDKLKSFSIIDTPGEHEFDSIVLLAQRLLNVPIALVSLLDDTRQWFKARCGIGVTETGRGEALCSHAIHVDDMMVVEDALQDQRFVDNALVLGPPYLRFYAGVPLRPSAPGHSDDLAGIGTLCVIDTAPRRFTDDDRAVLRQLAALVSALISARSSAATAMRLSQEAQRHAEMLERQQLQLGQAERMAGLGSWRLDLADMSLHWSDQVYAIYGVPLGQMPSIEEGLSFYPQERRAEFKALIERAASTGESFDLESDFRTADGRDRRVRSIGEAQLHEGRPTALIGVFQDVTDRHAREQTLRLSADTDRLTGLPNRSCFEQRLGETFARARGRAEPLCLLLLDLDGFKDVNDTFGHAAGDEVLRVMADRLRRITAPNAFAARLGGDEFVVLLTRPRDCARAEEAILSLLQSLRHLVDKDGQRRGVSATVGAAFLDDDIVEPSELTHRADLALYEAKRVQRGTGQIHGAKRPVTLGAALHAARG